MPMHARRHRYQIQRLIVAGVRTFRLLLSTKTSQVAGLRSVFHCGDMNIRPDVTAVVLPKELGAATWTFRTIVHTSQERTHTALVLVVTVYTLQAKRDTSTPNTTNTSDVKRHPQPQDSTLR